MSINIEEVIGRIKIEVGENTYNHYLYRKELHILILMDKYIENLLSNISIYRDIPDRLSVYIQALHELLLEKNNELTRRTEKRLAFEDSTHGRAIADLYESQQHKPQRRCVMIKRVVTPPTTHIGNAVVITKSIYTPAHIDSNNKTVLQQCTFDASVNVSYCRQEHVAMVACGEIADVCARVCSIGTRVSVMAKPMANNTKFIIKNIIVEKIPEQAIIDAIMAGTGVSSSTIVSSQMHVKGSISFFEVPM